MQTSKNGAGSSESCVIFIQSTSDNTLVATAAGASTVVVLDVGELVIDTSGKQLRYEAYRQQ